MIFGKVTYGRGTAIGFGWQYETRILRTHYAKTGRLVLRTVSVRLWRTVLRWSW